MNIAKLSTVLLASLLAAGCGSAGDDDLRQWMAELRATTKPRVTPLSEPKQFLPQTYSMEAGVEPFNAVKLTQALRRESNQSASNAALIAPEWPEGRSRWRPILWMSWPWSAAWTKRVHPQRF